MILYLLNCSHLPLKSFSKAYKKGLNIHGSYLSHLKIVDDIVLRATNTNELHGDEVSQALNTIGLKMNI